MKGMSFIRPAQPCPECDADMRDGNYGIHDPLCATGRWLESHGAIPLTLDEAAKEFYFNHEHLKPPETVGELVGYMAQTLQRPSRPDDSGLNAVVAAIAQANLIENYPYDDPPKGAAA